MLQAQSPAKEEGAQVLQAGFLDYRMKRRMVPESAGGARGTAPVTPKAPPQELCGQGNEISEGKKLKQLDHQAKQLEVELQKLGIRLKVVDINAGGDIDQEVNRTASAMD